VYIENIKAKLRNVTEEDGLNSKDPKPQNPMNFI